MNPKDFESKIVELTHGFQDLINGLRGLLDDMLYHSIATEAALNESRRSLDLLNRVAEQAPIPLALPAPEVKEEAVVDRRISKEDRRKQYRRNFYNKEKEMICQKCNETFIGKGKNRYCKPCKSKIHSDNMKKMLSLRQEQANKARREPSEKFLDELDARIGERK
jgi:hypothetical protein